MEQRYMKTFKPYTDEVKDTSIDALKAQLKGVTVLTSLVEVTKEDKDLGGNNNVPSPARAFDHVILNGLKTTPDSPNDDDLRERVAVLVKSILAIASFYRDERLKRIEKNKKKHQDEVHLDSPPHSRHQVNREELAVVVIDIAVENEKAEEEKKEEETEEEKATNEEDVKEEKEEEEKKDKERTAEKEAENEEKTKEEKNKNTLHEPEQVM
ncbi:FK506-binding protein 5-like [Capsicum annuum]|uniref:FK506-binding protein 5-like n=1 Tax=Capsicum annuum TaxID=4072 RepID=UPI001FB134AA|nr:FK506-binding protein 5-like [Capsicum annuum]